MTEAPVTYSTMMVKIDTNAHIGDEGAKVMRDRKVVGLLTAEQYGSQMLTIGDTYLFTPAMVNSFRVIANRNNSNRKPKNTMHLLHNSRHLPRYPLRSRTAT